MRAAVQLNQPVAVSSWRQSRTSSLLMDGGCRRQLKEPITKRTTPTGPNSGSSGSAEAVFQEDYRRQVRALTLMTGDAEGAQSRARRRRKLRSILAFLTGVSSFALFAVLLVAVYLRSLPGSLPRDENGHSLADGAGRTLEQTVLPPSFVVKIEQNLVFRAEWGASADSFGREAAPDGPLEPATLAVREGYLFMGDPASGLIRAISPGGSPAGSLSLPREVMPTGIVVAADGVIVVVDTARSYSFRALSQNVLETDARGLRVVRHRAVVGADQDRDER